MLKHFRKSLSARKAQDTGEALLVMSIIFALMLLMAAGFAIDLTKSVSAKNQIQTMAQDSTSVAVRSVGRDGSIRPKAVNEVISVYKARYEGVGRFDDEVGTRDSTVTGRVGCGPVTVPGVGEMEAPHFRITISGKRGGGGANEVVYSSSGGALVADPESHIDYDTSQNVYKTVRAEVWDVSPNFMLDIFGMGCQQLYADVASVSFGSQEAVDDTFEDTEEQENNN